MNGRARTETRAISTADRTRTSARSSLHRFRQAIRGSARYTHRRYEVFSVGIAVALVFMMLLNIVANAHLVTLSSPVIEVRQLGDASVARERIVAENFTTLEHLNELAEDPGLSEVQRLVYRHTPLILWYGGAFPSRHSTPIGMYYVVSRSESVAATATTIRYFLWFTDEDGGMPIERRLATFGHSMDREMVYRVTLLEDEVVGAWYQAPGHRQLSIDYTGESRAVFAVASANHNFRPVTQRELDHPGEKLLLSPLPHVESPWVPAHDPDFAALATQEVWEKYQIDVRDFVFVELDMPTLPTAATISVRIGDRWHYLHEQIGGGVTRPGYNQVGVRIGFPVLRGDIQEVRIVAYTSSSTPPEIEPLRVFVYPRDGVIA